MSHYTVENFNFDLPERLIADHPTADRTQSRLLHIASNGLMSDRQFCHLPSLLHSDDLLVINNSKVIRARLYGKKTSGGRVEIMLERVFDTHRALARVKASKSPKEGSTLVVGEHCLEVCERRGEFFVLASVEQNFDTIIEQCGELALPPYIKRAVCDNDAERYQTVYAEHSGSVAAPTAGLHFDQVLIQKLQAQGVHIASLTLHIGSGTYQPVRSESVQDHRMHREWFEVGAPLCTAIDDCRQRGGRVIAVGTTSVRALETLARNGRIEPTAMETDIFIYPGFEFQVVDAMITNFHLPRSTLMMLVCAFAGYPAMMDAYQHAVATSYRFFSYGDAMLIERPQ